MAAYAMVELTVHNGEQMGEYLGGVEATIAAHKGKYLIKGEAATVLEGSAGQHPLKVVLEFPSVAAAQAWYDSPEYQAILNNRLENSTANFLLIDGV